MGLETSSETLSLRQDLEDFEAVILTGAALW